MGLKDLAKMVNNATKEKTLEEEFLYQLNDTISRTQTPRQPSKTFKPSSLGGCTRRIFFEVSGAEVDKAKPADANLVGINESGTDRHERIQTYITKMKEHGHDVEWIDVEDYLTQFPQTGTRVVEKKGMETKLYNEVLNLSFMCDGVIKFKGVYYIIEIKTEASFKWIARTKPEEKHTFQASSYSACLGISNIMFLYENRDVCGKKVYHVEITQEDREEKVFGRIEMVNEYIRQQIAPPVTEQDKKDCKYCPFTTICREVGT